jgi:hypothetical protein
MVSHDHALGTGWHHVAAVRSGSSVALHVDGVEVAARTAAAGSDPLDLGVPGSLVIGSGPRGGFEGELADIRLDARALDADEIGLSAASPMS